MKRAATISECGLYRYDLSRTWDPALPVGLFIGLNPSTADGEKDDPTIRKEIGFGKRWGWGGFVKLNMWPFRSTWPKDVWAAADPVGPLGDGVLRDAVGYPWAAIVAAWGAQKHPRFIAREAQLRLMFEGVQLHSIGAPSFGGHPRHPLYLPYESELQPWPARGIASEALKEQP